MMFEALSVVCNMKLEHAVVACYQQCWDYLWQCQRLDCQHLLWLAFDDCSHSHRCQLNEPVPNQIAAVADPEACASKQHRMQGKI